MTNAYRKQRKQRRLIGEERVLLVAIAALGSIAFSGIASGELISYGDGVIVDTELQVMWVQDLNYAATTGFDSDGHMTYQSAQRFVSAMNAGLVPNFGFTDWRLPTTRVPDSRCDTNPYLGIGFHCSGSELGSMYYDSLGLRAHQHATPTSHSPFKNLKGTYWTSTEQTPGKSAMVFALLGGNQFVCDETRCELAVVPVRDFGTPDLATFFGGVEFPLGAASFADRVVEYDPEYGGGPAPDLTQQDARRILGTPDNGDMSLGNGGRLVVEFLDNRLTGSGDSRPDLFIFEVGGPETTFVEIRKNTGPWYRVGAVTGYAAAIDIDAYGFGRGDWFKSVRLTDDGNSAGERFLVGADLVAVGARTGIRWYSEEPWLTYWIQAHIDGKSELIIRGSTLTWHHLKGSAPGTGRAFHSSGSQSGTPTIIDSSQGPNIEWVPEDWPDRLGNGTHPESWAYFNALSPVFPEKAWCWNLKKRLGVGHVKIIEQPSARNGFALKIMFNDLGRGNDEHLSGSGFYAVELKTTGRGC